MEYCGKYRTIFDDFLNYNYGFYQNKNTKVFFSLLAKYHAMNQLGIDMALGLNTDRCIEWWVEDTCFRENENGFTTFADFCNKYPNVNIFRRTGPAITRLSGRLEWYWEGQLHRKDGPAVVWAEKNCEAWYYYGKLHRYNEPAVFWPNKSKSWFQYGEIHRDDGPAIEHFNGVGEWWHRGNHYKTLDLLGVAKWYWGGNLHREDGPAVEHPQGDKEWWWRGKQVELKDFVFLSGHFKSDGDRLMYYLTWL